MATKRCERKKYGLIGYPLGYTVSPAIHSEAFRKLGVDASYEVYVVEPSRFYQEIEEIAVRLNGFNVTTPYKEKVVELLDWLSPIARTLKAVNTVMRSDGELLGFNTDAEALEILFHRAGVRCGARALIVGAGGAAKAAAYALASLGAEMIVVANRSRERGEAFVHLISSVLGVDSTLIPLSEAPEMATKFDVVVNATPLGLKGHGDPLPGAKFREDAIVLDMVYNPPVTPMLRRALSSGAKCVSGLAMLVWQAALADEKWLGRRPPVKAMAKAGLRALGVAEDDKACQETVLAYCSE